MLMTLAEAIELAEAYERERFCSTNAKAIRILAASLPQWRPIETAPEGRLVVVSWLDAEDIEHPERHDFDYLEDGVWQNHNDNYEHFQCVAPPGSRGPKEDAPYKFWMPLAPVPRMHPGEDVS